MGGSFQLSPAWVEEERSQIANTAAGVGTAGGGKVRLQVWAQRGSSDPGREFNTGTALGRTGSWQPASGCPPALRAGTAGGICLPLAQPSSTCSPRLPGASSHHHPLKLPGYSSGTPSRVMGPWRKTDGSTGPGCPQSGNSSTRLSWAFVGLV